MSDIAEELVEERRQIEDILSPVKSSHVGAPSLDVGAPSLDVDSQDQVGPNPRPSCSKVGAKSLPRGHGFVFVILRFECDSSYPPAFRLCLLSTVCLHAVRVWLGALENSCLSRI